MFVNWKNNLSLLEASFKAYWGVCGSGSKAIVTMSMNMTVFLKVSLSLNEAPRPKWIITGKQSV